MKWVQNVKAEAEKPKETKPKKAYFPVRVTPALLARIDAVASELGLSRNRFVASCLAEAVRELEHKPKKRSTTSS